MAKSSSTGSGQVPAIRVFQLDSGAIGNLSSSVNLFRGDVNMSQTLFTLPGRGQDSGLDVSMAILYQSNIYRQAMLWNRGAPTGVLGLGWSLPLTYIEATENGSPVAATRQYTLYDSGNANSLARQTQAPRLFTMDAGLASGLHDGQAVPAGVSTAFRQHGLALDAGARLLGLGPWTIQDDVQQQLFTLLLTASGLEAFDGGEVYQLQNYQFWKVLYYPRYERWLVVTDKAVRRSFGGVRADTPQGDRTAAGNSVAWEVWWTGGGAAPLWNGPSAVTAGQTQVARAWYVATAADRFGNTVRMDYNGWERGSDGLIPGVEQRVGSGGKPFTRAVYLTRVTDAFGRTASLSYGNKLWSNGETDPREYADPHRAVPSNDASPYQDRYETLYLEQVVVRDTAGGTLFSVRMAYEVANVTASTGRLQGDTYKRFLTEVSMLDADGLTQPGLELGYYLKDVEGASPGALASITYPEGGIARYTYARKELDICQRSREVPRPAKLPEGASPRVYFGPDYAVVCYYQRNTLQLSFQVFTWAGSWLSWQLDPDDSLLDTGGLTLSTLEVHAGQSILTLSFDRLTEKVIYVFERDTAQPGQWQAATIAGKTTAKNRPPLSYSKSGLDVAFAGGATFFVVSQMQRSTGHRSYDVVTFRWTEQAWTCETIGAADYTWITAQDEHYATLDTKGTFTVHYLDGTYAWKAGPPAAVSGLNTIPLSSVALVPGAALVAVSNLVMSNEQRNGYKVWIAQWDAMYRVTVTPCGQFTDEFGPGNGPTRWEPQVVADTLVAVNGNVLRYNGAAWLKNTGLNRVPSGGRTQRYAFGPDYAIRIVAPTTGVGVGEGLVLAFDPEQDSAAWNRPPRAPKQALPSQSSLAPNWPTSGGPDYAVIGPYIYFRGTSNNWEDVVGNDALASLDKLVGVDKHFDSESLVDEGPSFLAYTAFKSGAVQEVQALLLANGGLQGAPVHFSDQKMVTPGRDHIGGPGVSAAGPLVFATYPAAAVNFDTAGSICLHHATDNAVSGPIVHYAVTGLVLDDGYQEPMPASFVGDAATAGCDPSGQVVKYFQATVYPGSAQPAAPRYGKVVSYYLNGLNDRTGDNFYDMLDGMLIRTETWDNGGVCRESTGTTYTVFERVAIDAGRPAEKPIQLRGGWVAPIRQVSFKDGVTTTKDTIYVTAGFEAPSTGQPAGTTTVSYGGDGSPETFAQTTLYGVQMEGESVSGLRAIHALSDLAQQTTTRSGSGGTVPVQAFATTYARWASALGEAVMVAAAEASFGLLDATNDAFPYASYRQGDTPAGWQLSSRITRRTHFGQEQENVDSLGTPTTTLYARDDLFAVAKCSNAPYGGMACLSFQSYEDTGGWTLHGVAYDQNEARTGTRSALLAGGTSAAVTVTPRNAESPYIAGCWYRTPLGYAPRSDSGWIAVVSVDGVRQAPVITPFAATGGAWAFITFPIPLGNPSKASTLAVELTAANGSGNQAVHLDSLFLVPLVNGLTAATYNEASQQVTSTMDAGGRTRHTYYDRRGRPTVTVGASGQVREIAQRFQSRAGSPGGAFQPGSPNAELTLHPAAGGLLETFRDGSSWRSRWNASAFDSDWQEGDGVLTHTATASDTLTWTEPAPTGTYAVYFELQAGEKADLSITAGDVTVGYIGGGYTGRQGGESWSPLVQPPTEARHWLLVVGDGVVLYFADGQLVFSRKTRPVGSTIVITTSGSRVSFRHLAVVTSVRVGLSYNDGAGRQRQVHQLHGADSLIVETVFDPLGRRLATTRSAPGGFGSGAQLAVLQYSAGFLDVTAFLAGLAGTWEMTGDVAAYYGGQTDGAVHRSNDEGYPYSGTRYEDSPRNVPFEEGRPGKPYAINLTVPAAQRQTLQYAWGTNVSAPTGLPPGDYYQDTLTSPVKIVSAQVTDQLGQLVAKFCNDAAGTLVARTAGTRAYRNGSFGPEATLITKFPNATTSGPQSNPSGYQQISTGDALQRPTTMHDSTAGETKLIFDGAGRLRFVQPALEASAAWFIYYKYDPLGRMIEEGTVAGAWDRSTLMRQAGDQDWPAQGNTVSVANWYDGTGADPSLIGMKHRTVSHNPAPAGDPDAGSCSVTETFAYNSAGLPTSVRMELAGSVAADGTIAYVYDELDELTRMDLPSGAPLSSIHYTYDDQGQIIAVGTGAGAADLAAYTYSADGSAQTETLANGAWRQAISYASPGWALSMSTRSADDAQGLGFTYTYEADGAVGTRKVAFDFPGGRETLNDAFTYDGQRRLTSAAGSHDVRFTSYDPNGNLWSAVQDAVEQSFTCVAGSDRLAQVSIGGEPSTIAFSARGQMTEGMGRKFTYDDCTAMTISIATADVSLRLAYGGAQQRVWKQHRRGAGSDAVYFCGAGQVPVARLAGGQWSVLIRGPLGLVAIRNDRLLFPLKDITQSTWAVVDATSLQERYVYLPFGQQVLAENSGGITFSNLYQGQEWDAEVGLYNFRSRMYDPVLRRFLSPDPARQFASLYLFAGDNPLSFTDPTGEMSTWGQVGIGVLMVATIAAGIILAPATGGESVLAATGVIEEGIELATLTEGEALAATGAVVAPTSVLPTVAGYAGTSALTSAGINGLSYDIEHGSDFTAGGFFGAVGLGAASGAAFGLATLGANQVAANLSTAYFESRAARIGSRILGMALFSGITSIASASLSSDKSSDWVGKSFAKGFVVGMASGAWLERGHLLGRTRTHKVESFIMDMERLAKSPGAMVTAGALVSGYVIWGAIDDWGREG